MPQTTRAQCPGCSASLADDGYSGVLTCAYCGTRVLFFLAPFVLLIFGIIVPLIWRAASRRARVRKLEEERDAIAPKLQARLNELESELARLTR
ncbi:MAG TPA: hypothetical protein VEO54_03555 [Thermoanaerobaculia bacterium]|nr:hypothetical protein [Thermoanaerobaculia bacterium]